MTQTAPFPRPPAVASLPVALSRLSQENALRQALSHASLTTTPGPISYPLGLSLGLFSAHVGYVAGMMLTFGLPALLVNLLTTVLLVSGFLALLRKRDRWVLGLAGFGAFTGLFVAPQIVPTALL